MQSCHLALFEEILYATVPIGCFLYIFRQYKGEYSYLPVE